MEAVEVKSAANGLPEGLAEIISAFANRPEGGDIVFGLDEAQGFAACGVYDVKKVQQGVSDLARSALDPPVQVTTEAHRLEGADIVVAHIVEAPRFAKPVRVRRTGRAYLRQYDGTYPLSDLEEQAFIADRGQPQFDAAPVAAAARADLDVRAVAAYAQERRATSPVFAGWTDDEILVQSAVLSSDGTPTTAGVLVFGVYPQAALPNSGIQATAWDGPAKKATSRLLDSVELVGPIPAIVDAAMAWVSRSTARAIVEQGDGHLIDKPEYPPVAVREIVANALVHRDLGPYAFATPVLLTLEPGRLIVSNPGGLFGVAVEALGRTDSHLRNVRLATILVSVRTADGQRVIERLGTGLPRTFSALDAAGLPRPEFRDQGIRFTAILRSAPSTRTSGGGAAGAPVTVSGATTDRVLAALAAGPLTIRQLTTATSTTDYQVRYAVQRLRKLGLVEPVPSIGVRNTRYRRVAVS